MPCGGILVVVEARGSEPEIEIGDDGVELKVARRRKSDVVGDGGGADAALGADDRDDPPDRLGVGRRKQPADRAHHVERADRRDQVVAHTAARELAIEQNVVVAADHDHPRTGVAHLGERIEAAEHVVATAFGLDDDDIGRRRAAVGLDRGGHAAHLNLEMSLRHAPILSGRLNGGSGLDGFAKGLNRYPRRRRDVLVAGGERFRLVRRAWGP